jgi:two-component system chemotaxis response regulator CheB
LARRNIIAIGCSVGGVDALQTIVRNLPADLPAAVFVVLHLSPHSPSLLPEILQRAGKLTAIQPHDGDSVRDGQIYVAPPDHHMIVEGARIRVVRGAKENRHRPAIDPLFRSVALAYGPRAIAVVLTGALDDGTAGLITIKRRHGVAIVQDPGDAFCPEMPRSALRYVNNVDHVLPIDQIGRKLNELVREEVPVSSRLERPSGVLEHDVAAAELEASVMNQDDHPGEPSPYACPECNGVLWERQEGDMLQFRCRVGHAYTAANLAADQALGVENALWAALRALEESASLNTRMAERARDRRHGALEDRFREQAESKRAQAEAVRSLLMESQKQFETAARE